MSLKDGCYSANEIFPITLSSGASLTGATNLGGLRLFGVVIPSDWTTANLTFQMSPDGGTTWANLKDQSGNEVVAAASASDCILVDPVQFAAMQHIRVRSGTSTTPVNQSAARTLKLVLRAV